MTRDSIGHINNLIDEIDILLGLLDESDSLLSNKEYKEKVIYIRDAVCEKDQKDLFLVGKDHPKLTSDKIHYDNDRAVMCENGALVGNKCIIENRGAKVLWESGRRARDISLVFKKSKKSKIIKIWVDEASRDGT